MRGEGERERERERENNAHINEIELGFNLIELIEECDLLNLCSIPLHSVESTLIRVRTVRTHAHTSR